MNTQRSMAWSMKVFQEWKYSRSTDDDRECPSDLFEVGDPDNLNFWVPRFINKVRRADGDPYPPRTIHQLLAGLQCSMLDHNNRLPKFLDRTNPVFLGGINGCSIGTMTVNFSGSFLNIKESVDTE